MSMWTSSSRFRRVLAHLTTPLLAGVLATLLLPAGEMAFAERLGAYLLGAYFVWLMLGLPGGLFHHRKPRRAWVYPVLAGAIMSLPLLLLQPGASLGDIVDATAYLLIGALVGLWYWFCADWQPRQPAANAEPVT